MLGRATVSRIGKAPRLSMRSISRKGILASYLRHKRILAGLSQGAVAKALGYSSAQFISNWERGISSPPGKFIPRLAQMYSLPEEEFILVLLREQEVVLWQLFDAPLREVRPRRRVK